ncbi:MAG: heavy metal translocating P-type ATPase [Oscillospiraceae bacterium]
MSRKQKKTLLRILLSAALLIIAALLPFDSWVRAVIFLVPYAVIGWDVLWDAVRNIAHGQVFDENFLMALATVGAFATGEYPEAVFVMLFYQVGELFQSCAVGKSRKNISALMDIRPDYANLERDGSVEQVDPEEVAVGDVIVVKPGEKIPLDGVVLEGTSAVDTAALTGESLPREVAPGDDVISGCVNESGLLRIRVTKPFGESTVSKILDLVENASSRKAKAENFITKFARYYTPAVVIGAVLLAVLPPLIGGGDWGKWFHQALVFLVVSCPCALVISVPLSFFGGIGGASRAGILVKGGNYLEVLAKTEIVVFDKTGTLTRGVFRVTSVHPEGCEEAELLELAALAESWSDHPISRSIKEAWDGELDTGRVSDARELSGRGVQVQVDGQTVCAGNDKLMNELGVSFALVSEVGTVVHVAREGQYLGYLIVSDEVKPDAAQAIAALKKRGVRRTVMLTGDAKEVGEAVAAQLGLDEVHTRLLPADKVERVESLLKETSPKGALAFVGDGINDAPVLSRADVGIAMGALGSDAAIEAADVVLMDDKPSKIADAIAIARRTLGIVKQNIVFALGVKALVLILGAVGIATMWLAVFADVGVAVLAILNAMRALNVKK